jgi:hypothetical protein
MEKGRIDNLKEIKENQPKEFMTRGEVISSFSNIEGLLDGVILVYYARKKHYSSFIINMLSDEYFTFALRKSVFIKILKEGEFLTIKKINQLEDSLNKLGMLRNLIAHARIIFNKEKPEFFDPKKKDFFNLNEKYNQYEELFNKILTDLSPIARITKKIEEEPESKGDK